MEGRVPRLLAVSDLHVAALENREAVAAIPASPADWLILAGDLGDTPAHLQDVLELLEPRFAQLLWVPGNHDLWASPERGSSVGVGRYEELVAVCRRFGVLTPEDPFSVFEAADGPVVVAPLFTLYDYTFREPGVGRAEALAAAARAGIVCTDESLLDPAPYPSREAWCADRVHFSRARLEALPPGSRTVLVSHFPLRRDLAHLRHIPQFELWCGTLETEDWHRRYGAVAVVHGHLHRPETSIRDGVAFHEVSFGYPQERRRRGVTEVELRVVLTGLGGPPTAPRRAVELSP